DVPLHRRWEARIVFERPQAGRRACSEARAAQALQKAVSHRAGSRCGRIVDDGIGLLGLGPVVEEASTTPEHDLLLSGEVVGNAPSWRQLDSGELIISPADVVSRDVQSVQWSSGPRHERADDNGSLSARADDR